MTTDTTTDTLHDRVHAAARAIRDRAPVAPKLGLILGSGLGGYADGLTGATVIPYAEIPGFPVSNVAGHHGRLVLGERAGVPCVAMQGRVHMYEGHAAATVAFPARVLVALADGLLHAGTVRQAMDGYYELEIGGADVPLWIHGNAVTPQV